jgi:Kef-type K+ transport system membrane component KefB
MDLSNHPAVMVLSIAVVSSLLSEIRIGVRIPVAVWEILLGMILGPAVLGLASISNGELWGWFAPAGLAALLFMAGMDIDFARVRGRPIELAVGGWLLSLGLGLFLSAILWVLGIVQAPLIVALALSRRPLSAQSFRVGTIQEPSARVWEPTWLLQVRSASSDPSSLHP